MTSNDETRKVAELLKDERIAALTTTALDGTLMSRPMAMQEVEFDGDLWFFAARDSRKVAQVRERPQVNVATSGSSSWVSLTGIAVVIDDLAKKQKLWNKAVEAWFPDGPDDADVVLLRVEATSAEYWNSPGGRVASVISFAKAKLTGQAYDGGENERVDL
ncbi:pyridoxamine 5'-phosphate oxidase family protein [Modestobacter roseus]|uniref:General stress protein 26 n=1 Tax=Modestobacter roseus TaxID=1181884 RepID=A0A562IV11_9ACTN|nr:pyridoxamine 5'-phosphate oxidase family protein [Modestobacter roseus]MQA33579.1 pyridoxamine 5'-phosphate oxidase [Modestobacter roseus]TWH74788.1 general stress protein 26 [Modestobacter roseus]